jgi:hypothetical protein
MTITGLVTGGDGGRDERVHSATGMVRAVIVARWRDAR